MSDCEQTYGVLSRAAVFLYIGRYPYRIEKLPKRRDTRDYESARRRCPGTDSIAFVRFIAGADTHCIKRCRVANGEGDLRLPSQTR